MARGGTGPFTVNRRRTFSPDRLAKGTPLVAVPLGERASRSDRAATRALATWKSGAVLETPGFVAGLDDVAVMSEAIEQRGCHLGVVEDARPLAEGVGVSPPPGAEGDEAA